MILEVNKVCKVYRQYPSEYKRVLSILGFNTKPISEHWVLKDISFSIKRGEALALIGENGAGKSTLLKLISGVSAPTEGSIKTNGKIAAILELGMGFNPEFTGRQNAYHSASIMGYSTSFVDTIISDIEEFAELGDYFDEPIRVYSSGMQTRLAFSIATAVRPDILIVDEALSVGDAYFQHKSFAKIKKMKEQGTSLLIVSHDSAAILSVCDRVILLDKGSILIDSAPQEALDYYNAIIAAKENSIIEQKRTSDGEIQTISGTDELEIMEIKLLDKNQKEIELLGVGDSAKLSVAIRIKSDIPSLVCGFLIKDRVGQPIFGTNTFNTEQILSNLKAGDFVEYTIDFEANFGEGSYSITIAFHEGASHIERNYLWVEFAKVFKVANLSKNPFVGMAWIPVSIEVKR